MKKSSAVIMALLILLSLCACAEKKTGTVSAEQAVASVNGETVSQQELDYFCGRLRAEVINEFVSQYSLEYDDNFWSAACGSTTPEDELKKRAMDECVRAKIQLVLCREHGIYDDITFAGLYGKAVSFNNASKSGTVSVTSIRLESFYTYYVDTGVMELKNKLAAQLAPSDDEVESRVGEYTSDVDGEMLKNSAKDALTEENYEKYIDGLCDSAEIVIMNK